MCNEESVKVKGYVRVEDIVCKGCALCTAACPKDIMEINENYFNAKGYHVAQCKDSNLCIACGMCATICPDSAITVEAEK
jgi:2-oxoglutarate ferredoxin oxidoreductase subunit delta